MAAAIAVAIGGCAQNGGLGGGGLVTSSVSAAYDPKDRAQAYMDCLVEHYYYFGAEKAAIDKALEACAEFGKHYAAEIVGQYRPRFIDVNVEKYIYPRVRRQGRDQLIKTVSSSNAL